VDEIDGRVAEIDAELSEEEARKNRLGELQRTLNQLSAVREAKESTLANIKKSTALLDEQRKLTSTLSAGLERSRTALASLETRLASKESDRNSYADLVNRAADIESAYKAWQKARKELEEWDKVASQFRDHEKERTPLLEKIAGEKARLEEEKRSLLAEEEEIGNQLSVNSDVKSEIVKAQKLLEEAEEKVRERIDVEGKRNEARERQAAMKVENETLKVEMNQLKERIEVLKSADGATCPLCGQELSE